MSFLTHALADANVAEATDVAAKSTAPRSAGSVRRKTKTKPIKKRSISVANLCAANHRSDCLTKANKKYKETVLTHSEKKREEIDTTFKMKANQPSFPVTLMGIMSAPHNEEFITFFADGQRFIILHPEALVKHVLPIHFEDNIPSFDQFLYLLAQW